MVIGNYAISSAERPSDGRLIYPTGESIGDSPSRVVDALPLVNPQELSAVQPECSTGFLHRLFEQSEARRVPM